MMEMEPYGHLYLIFSNPLSPDVSDALEEDRWIIRYLPSVLPIPFRILSGEERE